MLRRTAAPVVATTALVACGNDPGAADPVTTSTPEREPAPTIAAPTTVAPSAAPTTAPPEPTVADSTQVRVLSEKTIDELAASYLVYHGLAATAEAVARVADAIMELSTDPSAGSRVLDKALHDGVDSGLPNDPDGLRPDEWFRAPGNVRALVGAAPVDAVPSRPVDTTMPGIDLG